MTDLRRIDHVRRDFVANVSHELKTPIGALTVPGRALLDRPDRSIARPPHRPGGRARPTGWPSIVDDLLDLSVIEAPESPTASRAGAP